MKRLIAFVLLSLAATLAFALPAPRDIETAVNAGDLARAESLLREVLAEKPGSAKAHYEMGQVLAREGKSADARRHLEEARRLDPTLGFARDPKHFQELLDKLPAGALVPPAPVAKAVSGTARAENATSSPSTATYVLVGGALLAFIVLATRFMRRRSGAVAGGGMSGYGMAGTGGYPGAPASGSGMGAVGGAVLGGIAGMAAGYGLSKVFGHSDDTPRPSGDAGGGNGGYVPFDSTPSGQTDFGAFDSGTGDDWGADGSGGDSDDSW